MSQKVLLVDDVSMFVELQKDYLQLSAVDILTARDGKEALKRAKQEAFDLVITDVLMPGMDGFELTERLRKDKL